MYGAVPIVDMNVELKASSENLTRIHVFPTPLSPIRSSLKRKSYVFAIVQVDNSLGAHPKNRCFLVRFHAPFSFSFTIS